MSHRPQEFGGMRVTVMGLGQFGGGAGVVRWLCDQGARLVVTDLRSETALTSALHVIRDLIAQGSITLRLGKHFEEDFTAANCDLVVANPAVPKPWVNPYLLRAHESGIPITTEIRFAFERLNRQRIIGVTGTSGKSTTAAMIHHAMKRSGQRVHIGGNIGGTLLSSLRAIQPDDWIVLELSSAMLYWLGEGVGSAMAKGLSPCVAVLTNLTPNHLDWHETFEHYEQSKANILRYQCSGDHAVRGEPLQSSSSLLRSAQTAASDAWVGLDIPLRIPGKHNQHNAQLALAAAQCAAGLPPQESAPLLADFHGLPHRLQLIGEREGLCFYNDSKSTTPHATRLAVSSFDEPGRIHLIAGGHDKGVSLSPIAELAPSLAGLYTIGQTGTALVAMAGAGEYCSTLDRAVLTALGRMRSGEVLLLSPGCASWDQFSSYEERGDAFTRLVSTDLPANGRTQGYSARHGSMQDPRSHGNSGTSST